MVKRRICYLLLLVLGGYFVLLYDFRGLRFLYCCVFFIPLVSFLLLIPKVFLCKVGVEAEDKMVTRGEPVRLDVIVENRGILPTARILAVMCWSVQGEKELTEKKWLCGFGRGREEIPLELSASHCGRAELVIKKARACDYLGLFSLPVRRKEAVTFCVAPVITPVFREEMEQAGLQLKLLAGEGEEDMALRNYQPGDSLHRIYWKLSVKAGELQVREFEQNGSIRLFLNFSGTFRQQARKWDTYLDKACSLICFLMGEGQEAHVIPKIVWPQGESFIQYEMQDMEALQGWIYAVLMQEYTGQLLAEEEIPFLRDGCHLEEDCKLYFGEQCVYE